MNHQNLSKSSLLSMMMSNGSIMMSSSSLFSDKGLMFSDLDMAEQIEQEDLLRSKVFSSSVSSSLFVHMLDEKDQLDLSSDKRHKNTKLLSLESCRALPEHDFDDALMTMMSSFQKTMSISSHSEEDELTALDNVKFRLIDDATSPRSTPTPVSTKTIVTPKTSNQCRSKANVMNTLSLSIPSFKAKSTHSSQEGKWSLEKPVARRECASPVAPSHLITPTFVSSTSKAVEIINLVNVDDAPVSVEECFGYEEEDPAYYCDPPQLCESYDTSFTTQDGEDDTSLWHAAKLQDVTLPSTERLQLEYMAAVERLKMSMERSRQTRSAVARDERASSTCCASANTGALLRQHHAQSTVLPAQQHGQHQQPLYYQHSE
jgi:hypothetical protein